MFSPKCHIKNYTIYSLLISLDDEIRGEPNPNLLLNSFDNILIDAKRIIEDPKNYIGSPEAVTLACEILYDEEIKEFLKDFKSFNNYSVFELRHIHSLFSKIDNLWEGIIY